jgi:hypothetical protein
MYVTIFYILHNNIYDMTIYRTDDERRKRGGKEMGLFFPLLSIPRYEQLKKM